MCRKTSLRTVEVSISIDEIVERVDSSPLLRVKLRLPDKRPLSANWHGFVRSDPGEYSIRGVSFVCGPEQEGEAGLSTQAQFRKLPVATGARTHWMIQAP